MLVKSTQFGGQCQWRSPYLRILSTFLKFFHHGRLDILSVSNDTADKFFDSRHLCVSWVKLGCQTHVQPCLTDVYHVASAGNLSLAGTFAITEWKKIITGIGYQFRNSLNDVMSTYYACSLGKPFPSNWKNDGFFSSPLTAYFLQNLAAQRFDQVKKAIT